MSASVTHAETENYKLVKQWGSEDSGNGQFPGLWGIAVDSSGNVYVGDANNHIIQKFDSNGKFVTKWSVPYLVPEQSGRFNPFNLALDF